MDGLKQKLNEWLKNEQGRMVPIDAIERQVKAWGYKISNYERRLRPSESPQVRRIMKNGAIVGYQWTTPFQTMTANEFLKKYPSKEQVKELTLF